MKDPPQHRFEFGSFCFDEAQHLLTRDGSPISLPPKCFGLLCVLVKNPGQLLEKSRLMHELWPETFVEEANLSNTVALLRKALGDEAGTAQYVQTIPRIGYRFIARVKALPNGEESSDGHRLPIRILVFPFRCSSGAGEPEHLAYGLAEAISSTLAELNTFTVRSMQLAMRFDLIHWDPGIVATEADVDVILSGTLDRSCDRIHAITQLIAARSGTLLWARSWDIDANDLFHFHQGVVQLIMRFFFRSTSGDIPQALPADASITSEAYELYLRATQLSLKRSPESAALARDMYIACVEKDPNYAPAWARLGRCYRFLDKLGAETDKDGRAALKALERAFALNPDLAIAHNIYTPIQADMGQAESAMVRLLRRAGAHDNDPELFSGLVHACRYCGLLDASLAAHYRARELDPNAQTSVAHTFFAKSDFARALYWYGAQGVYTDALALASMSQEREASALLWTRKDIFHVMPEAMHSLHAYLEKDFSRCIAAIEQAEQSKRVDPELRYYLARQAARIGAVDLANKTLLRSVEEGYCCMTALRQDPWLELLRATTQFAQVFELVRTRETQSRRAFVEAGGASVLYVPDAGEAPS